MMAKKKTISTRWREWAEEDGEFYWAYGALTSMAIAFAGLIGHLWILHGLARQIALIIMIVCAFGTELILILRKRWWWLTFWTYIILGVICWEIASVFIG